MNNDLLNDIFNILKLSQAEESKTLKDLDSIIKAKLANNLIEKLPNDKVEEIKNIKDTEKEENQKFIASIISTHYSAEQIEEERKIAVGQILLTYVDFVFQKLGIKEQEDVKKILEKYNIKT